MNIVFAMCLFILSSHFTQKWYVPVGIGGGSHGRLLVGDTDRDSCYELVIGNYAGSQKLYVCELHLPDTWIVDSFSYYWGPIAWAMGDFDCDGRFDLAIQTSVDTPPVSLLSVAESIDSFSYPTQEVWRDTVGFGMVLPVSAYDLDRDGFTEIIQNSIYPQGLYEEIGIYEAISDNQYELIFYDRPDTMGYYAPVATHAFGDFDGDGFHECVFAGGKRFWVYESPMNNTYVRIAADTLATSNIIDCFTVPDADQDGKMEFGIKGYYIMESIIHAFILEAVGNNSYQIIKSYSLPGGDYYGGFSDAGDVDGDSVPEIVLEARQNVFIIKGMGNDSFAIWDTLPGNVVGSNIRVFDLDNNGLAEVIISGNHETRIYEYEPAVIEEGLRSKQQLSGLKASPNPFYDKIYFRISTFPEAANVSLKIYNAMGEFVKSFPCTSIKQVSVAPIIWNGTDNKNVSVPAGIYFLELNTGHDRVTEKILKLR